MGDYHYRIPENYNPTMLDYHYRLEWDLVGEHEYTTRRQMRIFDQGGERAWNLFMDYKAQMEEAQARGMIENLAASTREVRLSDDWELGWPTFPPTLLGGESGR